MSDSNPDRSTQAERAQPFLYAPPNGDAARISQKPGANESATKNHGSDDLVQKAFERGVAEGKAAARAEFEKEIAEIRGQISGAVRAFSKDCTNYFGRVEGEVVRLSLSIARKILNRESQIDPLVLTGVVRVALQKLNGDTQIVLRAHHDEVRFWNDYFRQSTENLPAVTVTADPSLSRGHCTLETDFGTTEIGLETQLKEIELGFLDLLEQRPKGDN